MAKELGTITRPKFVWFILIYSIFLISYQGVVYIIYFSGLLRLNLPFIQKITLFEYAISLAEALLKIGGAFALFYFRPIAVSLLLAGFLLEIAGLFWNLSTKPEFGALISGNALFFSIALHAASAYVVYYAYWMKKRGMLRRRPAVATISSSQASQRVSAGAPIANIAPDWILNNVAEASKTAGKIYTGFIGLLAYCALTVVSTSDRQILFDEPARLPLVNLGVPLLGFFAFSPVLMFGLFVYLQIYLHRIKGLITQLRTQYAPVEDRRLYPWMLTIAEEPEPGQIGQLQKAIVTASLWWSLPFVLFLYPIWFMKKHDPVFSYVVGIIPLTGVWLVVWFWHAYDPSRKRGRATLATVGSVLSGLMLLLIIPLSNNGFFQRGITNISLKHEVLITKPDQDYESIYWADLHEAHLEAARLDASVLSRANLQGASLRFANLSSTKMDKANLLGANLQFALLIYSEMQGAVLADARLERANLSRTKLEGANFYNAHLEGAKLFQANLDKANFIAAHLEKADLRFVDAKQALFGGAVLTEANLAHANLSGAYLEKANLEAALLNCVNFEDADFRDTRLNGADLSHARLRGAKNLAVGQLAEAKSIFMATLDPQLLKIIKKEYPVLWATHETNSDTRSTNCLQDPPPTICNVCELLSTLIQSWHSAALLRQDIIAFS